MCSGRTAYRNVWTDHFDWTNIVWSTEMHMNTFRSLNLVIAIGMNKDFQPAYNKIFLYQITNPTFKKHFLLYTSKRFLLHNIFVEIVMHKKKKLFTSRPHWIDQKVTFTMLQKMSVSN